MSTYPKSDAWIQIVITTTYGNLSQLVTFIATFNYHLIGVNLQISTKSAAQFPKYRQLKTGIKKKQKFPICSCNVRFSNLWLSPVPAPSLPSLSLLSVFPFLPVSCPFLWKQEEMGTLLQQSVQCWTRQLLVSNLLLNAFRHCNPYSYLNFSLVKTINTFHDIIYTLFTTVYWWSDARPYHHACAVQQWCHHWTAYNVTKKLSITSLLSH